jgi:hypothetical protein
VRNVGLVMETIQNPMMDGMAVRDTIPYNFDDEARAELLAFLVVGQPRPTCSA